MTVETIWQIAKKKTPRIGLLGGTFDPIHNGHVAMCGAVMKAFRLDEVWLLVAGDPAHKGMEVSPAEDRLRMVALACTGHTGLCPNDMEIRRPGVTYTVDTLEELKSALPPHTELYYLIGADTFYQLPSWKDYQRVLELTSFIVIPREGRSTEEMRAHYMLLSNYEQMRIILTDTTVPDISSTDVRRRVAQGLPVEGMISPAVGAYIGEKGLYRQEAMSFDQAREELKRNISPHRFQHTMGVIKTAEELALRYGCDPMEARWAALLHDCAKEEEKKELSWLHREYDLPFREEYLFAPQLIHAPLGAILAREKYQIHDEDIRRAIARHTTGETNMSVLDKVLLLADAMEPGRDYDGVEAVREAARHDLDEGVMEALGQSISFVMQKGGYLSVDSVYARQQLWIKKRKKAATGD